MKKIKKVDPARRVKIIIEEGKDSLVSYGGGLLIDEFIHRLGLSGMINATVKVKERERGFKESEAVLGLAVSMITGGVCLDDLIVLREEEAFKEIWRHGDIPHPATMGDFLRRFDLGHIRQLESVITQAFRTVYRSSEKMPVITLDIDSTLDEIHGSKKEGARWAYTGIRALNPIMGFVRETGAGCTAGSAPAMCIPPTGPSASSGSAITKSKTLPMPLMPVWTPDIMIRTSSQSVNGWASGSASPPIRRLR